MVAVCPRWKRNSMFEDISTSRPPVTAFTRRATLFFAQYEHQHGGLEVPPVREDDDVFGTHVRHRRQKLAALARVVNPPTAVPTRPARLRRLLARARPSGMVTASPIVGRVGNGCSSMEEKPLCSRMWWMYARACPSAACPVGRGPIPAAKARIWVMSASALSGSSIIGCALS